MQHAYIQQDVVVEVGHVQRIEASASGRCANIYACLIMPGSGILSPMSLVTAPDFRKSIFEAGHWTSCKWTPQKATSSQLSLALPPQHANARALSHP